MDKKIVITEKDHHEEEWFAEARKQTIETLPTFVSHLMNDYHHDYGTICHAVGACALAAAWAADNSENGGITGFQAGFVMWDFIREWQYRGNKCGLKIVDYDNMLYPQYADKFEKTLSSDIWRHLQAEAKRLLTTNRAGAHPRVVKHWQDIDNDIVPFGYKVVD